MSNLIRLDPAFRVLLPEGATGGYGEIVYLREYRVAALAAGAALSFRVAAERSPQGATLGKLLGLTTEDVWLLGAKGGDPVPPYVELRIYPTCAGQGEYLPAGEPIIITGRPHEHPAGSGLWDLRDLEADPNGPRVIGRQEQLDLTSATQAAQAAAGRVTAAQLDLTAERGAVAQAVADSAQQQEVALALQQQLQSTGFVYLGTDSAGIAEVVTATAQPVTRRAYATAEGVAVEVADIGMEHVVVGMQGPQGIQGEPGPIGPTGLRGPAGPVYLDVADGIPGVPYNGTLALFAAPRAMRWTAGGLSLGTASTTAVTLTISRNGAAAATLAVPANATVSGALSATVTLAAGDRVGLVLSGATGGSDLAYWLRGEPL